MAKRNHVTFGGQGQHEFYLPTTGNGHKNRRDRRKCDYYSADSKYCSKIHNQCVGPTVCRKYSVVKTTQHTKTNYPVVGTVVYTNRNAVGKIVSISQDICTIEFSSGRKVSAKYPDV